MKNLICRVNGPGNSTMKLALCHVRQGVQRVLYIGCAAVLLEGCQWATNEACHFMQPGITDIEISEKDHVQEIFPVAIPPPATTGTPTPTPTLAMDTAVGVPIHMMMYSANSASTSASGVPDVADLKLQLQHQPVPSTTLSSTVSVVQGVGEEGSMELAGGEVLLQDPVWVELKDDWCACCVYCGCISSLSCEQAMPTREGFFAGLLGALSGSFGGMLLCASLGAAHTTGLLVCGGCLGGCSGGVCSYGSYRIFKCMCAAPEHEVAA